MTLYKNTQAGFSLIELMIVLAIIAIIASIAVPSYGTYTERARRAEGKAFALDIASRQERHFTQYSNYASSLTGTGDAALNTSSSSENSAYNGAITHTGGNTSTYIITVTPVINDTSCGALTLRNTGERNASATAVASEIAICWR